MSKLAAAFADVRSRVLRCHEQRRSLNEQNTKATLIEPILRALGWDVEDVEEVHREFKVKRSDKPVDYALLVHRNARLFVQAKALGEDLSDRRWMNQIMGYAAVAGVEWIVLTDGNEYKLFNSHATVAVDEKLFRAFSVAAGERDALDTLELLGKQRLEENRIDALWRAHFVDRKVRHALEQLLSRDSDMLLVNHVRSAARDLTAEEIRASLARCQMRLDFPFAETLPPPSPPIRKVKGTGKRKGKGASKLTPDGNRVRLADLISAGLLHPPLELERTFKGQILKATALAGGIVRFQGTEFPNLSMAGGAARASVLGRKKGGKLPATNGWSFWMFRGPNGDLVELDTLRREYLDQGPDQIAASGG